MRFQGERTQREKVPSVRSRESGQLVRFGANLRSVWGRGYASDGHAQNGDARKVMGILPVKKS
jgi:hypothetical protein